MVCRLGPLDNVLKYQLLTKLCEYFVSSINWYISTYYHGCITVELKFNK